MLGTPERKTGPEMLDLPSGSYTREELEGSLADIAMVNRYLGDYRAVVKHVARMVEGRSDEHLSILDIGTGSADIPLALAQWGRKNRLKLKLTAIDSNMQTVAVARTAIGRTPGINLLAGDGLNLPFADRSFDLVLCSKTLHHFTETQAVRLIGEAVRVARRGYLILDLRRSRIACALIFMLSRIFTRNRLTRNDAPLSVLRAFTPRELIALATEAGASNVTLFHEPFWLMVLTGGEA